MSNLNPIDTKYLETFKNLFEKNEITLRNGQRTLVLTPNDIVHLNNVLTNWRQASTNGSSSITQDYIHIIEDTMENLCSLQIYGNDKLEPSVPRGVNVSSFTSLKHLHLMKTSPRLLADIDCLRPQLKSVQCYKSIDTLKDLLRSKDDTFGMSSFWSELRHLDVSSNDLKHFDDSLSLLPNLEYLDVSHNNLESVEGAKLSKNLELLNLGFNSFKIFPTLNSNTVSTLKTLIFKYNSIESLNGLEYLVHLKILDLSYNCLTSHTALQPISELYILNCLILSGNPITFNSKHRILTTKYIHLNAFHRGVHLDGCKITPKEYRV